ncbi:ATP-binding cassette domain-containing protein [Anaerolentibacter hominis]|uniref:ATP-binding cassette domain-containing protein n=1 Tax=Anaerolentibacter hominis TaxID=3079009 RepID=UPI0031B88AE5
MKQNEIVLEHIKKAYGQLTVFRDLNLTIPGGKITALMGASGIGKTTLLRILMGLEKPDSGRITGMAGRRMTAVFQEDRLCEEEDAFVNVKLGCGFDRSDEMIRKEFERVDLKDYEKKPVSSLSGGMKRRVAIVRAMLAPGDLVILDEPFQGLDKNLKELVMDYVAAKVQGKTVIMVTHQREEAEKLAEQILTLE